MGHHIMKWAKLNFVARHYDPYVRVRQNSTWPISLCGDPFGLFAAIEGSITCGGPSRCRKVLPLLQSPFILQDLHATLGLATREPLRSQTPLLLIQS